MTQIFIKKRLASLEEAVNIIINHQFSTVFTGKIEGLDKLLKVIDTSKQGLTFEILSTKISDDQTVGKKHVIYTLQIRFISDNDDLTPSVIERRYTQFELLYNGLKKEFPALMAEISFPKKKFTGNFDNELISTRSTAFEALLAHTATESKLRMSKPMQTFLQEPELSEAKELFDRQSYALAFDKFQSVYKLLTKIFLDRSHSVLLTLCRIVVCCEECPKLDQAIYWCDLALYRFDGVSDTDLLELYLPLIHACIKIYEANSKNVEDLNARLFNMRMQGINDNNKRSLLQVLNDVEHKLS